MAMVSAAKATGWAWKLPPEIAVSSSGNTIGLSVTAPASMVRVRAAFIEQVERGAHHLRLAAEAVRVLDLAAAGVAGDDLLPSSSSRNAAATRIWPGCPRTSLMRGSNGLTLALERIDRQSAGGDCGSEHALAREQSVERNRGRGLGAVDQRQAFLRAQLQRLHAQLLQRCFGRQDVAGDVDAAVAHQRGDEMRERSEVAGGADAALRRDDRHGVAIEQACSASITSGRTPE